MTAQTDSRFINISEHYGDHYAGATVADYRDMAGYWVSTGELDTAPEFFESYDGIYQRNPDGTDIRVAIPVLDYEWAAFAPPVTISEAAEWFGVKPGTLRAALQRHALDGYKSGKTWLVSREDVRQYLRRTHRL